MEVSIGIPKTYRHGDHVDHGQLTCTLTVMITLVAPSDIIGTTPTQGECKKAPQNWDEPSAAAPHHEEGWLVTPGSHLDSRHTLGTIKEYRTGG
jgi:hypothetical protein